MKRLGGWTLAALLLVGTAQAGDYSGRVRVMGTSEGHARTQLGDAWPGVRACLRDAQKAGDDHEEWIKAKVVGTTRAPGPPPAELSASQPLGDALQRCLVDALRAAVIEPEGSGNTAAVTTWFWRGRQPVGGLASRRVEGGLDAAWSADGSHLAVVGGPQVTVFAGDLEGEPVVFERKPTPGIGGGVPKPPPSALRAVYLPDGSLAVGHTDGSVRLWPAGVTQGGAALGDERPVEGLISTLTAGPDGRLIVASARGELAGMTGRLAVYGRHQLKLAGLGGLVPPSMTEPGLDGVAAREVGWTAEGDLIAVFAGASAALDVDSLEPSNAASSPIEADALLVSAVSPDGRWMAWGVGDGSVYVRERGQIETRRISFAEETAASAHAHTGWRVPLEIGTQKDGVDHYNAGGPEGERIARRSIGGTAYATWPVPAALTWSSAGKLAIGHAGGALVWDLQRPERAWHLPGGARVLAWHPEGDQLAAVGERGVRLWSLAVAQLQQNSALSNEAAELGLIAIIGSSDTDGRVSAALAAPWLDGGVRPGEPVALGTTDLDALHRAVGVALEGVHARWQEGAGAAGILTVRLKLEADGSVTFRSVALDELGDPGLTAWVTAQLRTIELEPSEQPVVVSYPIVFD